MINNINSIINSIAEDLRELVRKDNDAIRLFSDYAEDIIAKLPIVEELTEEIEVLENANGTLSDKIDDLYDTIAGLEAEIERIKTEV